MIGRGLFLVAVLSGCVLSLPVTPSQLENEDVKVMKCIVEVLADALSRPRITPVSQECLVTLKTDDRLIKILRHHKFLKELQEIAVQGDHERAGLRREAGTPAPTTPPLPTADADQSMLEALGSPGERSILSQQKRTGNGDGRGSDGERDGEDSRAEGEEAKRGSEGDRGSRDSESADEWGEGRAERREEEEDEEEGSQQRRANSEEESEEKRGNSQEESEEKRGNSEESEEETKRGDESDEKRDARGNTKEKKWEEDGEEEKDKRYAFYSHKHEEEGERWGRGGQKRWTKRAKYQSLRKKSAGTEAQRLDGQQEVPHHSKEVVAQEEEEVKRDVQRSPEERELQMIAHRAPEERRALEEEGSASRKSEEPEIESLAAIESELENVAQKLHELRRG